MVGPAAGTLVFQADAMSKPKISAREVVQDIKSGMTDPELMQKYSLTPKGLESLFSKPYKLKSSNNPLWIGATLHRDLRRLQGDRAARRTP